MSAMPSEIAFPFHLGPNNALAVETEPNALIRQHVNSLINTEPGERVVLGNYGVPLSDSLFESGEGVVASDLASDITDALSTFEPGVGIKQIVPIPGVPGDGVATVSVEYLRTDAATTSIAASRSQNVAVISASGRVTEVVRG